MTSFNSDGLKAIVTALLKGNAKVVASGAGSVAIDGDVTNSPITAKVVANGPGSLAIDGDVTNSPITINVDINSQQIELSGEALSELTRQIQQQLLPHRLCDLPDIRTGFYGREEKKQALVQALQEGSGSQAITALRGIGGIGKTELAVQIAWQVIPFYPQAQILVDLQGTALVPRDPTEIMEDIIRRFTPEANLPNDTVAIKSMYRQLLRDKKCLLILDNAADAFQIQPLLPPRPSAAIITSRRLIDHPDVDVHKLDNLARKDAITVLLSLLSHREHDELGLDKLAEACVDHPLALTVAGSFLNNRPHIRLAEYATQITRKREDLRLEGLAEYDVMASLALSLAQLCSEDSELTERWRNLSVFPDDFDASAASAVMGLAEDGIAGDMAVGAILERLNNLGFIEIEQRGTTRYRLHDLMRDLALKDQHEDRFASEWLRYSSHYCHLLAEINQLYLSGEQERVILALQTFDIEASNIVFGQSWAASNLQLSIEVLKLANEYPIDGANGLSLRLHNLTQVVWLKTGIIAARALGDRQSESIHLGNLGSAYARLGKTHKAIKYHQQALNITQEYGEKIAVAGHLCSLGNDYFTLAETRTAIEYHKQALNISREIGHKQLESTALGNLGNIYNSLGETLESINYYDQALNISREVGDRKSEGTDLGNLGIAYHHLGETLKAINHHQQALIISQQVGNRQGEGHNLINLGNVYGSLGDTREAIKLYKLSLSISQEIGDKQGEYNCLGNLGIAYAALGKSHKAIDYHKRALNISPQIGNRHGEASDHINIGNAFGDHGDALKSIEHYELALIISKEIGNKLLEGNCLGNLGTAYLGLGETRKGLKHLRQALHIFRKIRDRQEEGICLGNLGTAYAALGTTDKAIDYLTSALSVFEEIESPHAEQVRSQLTSLINR